MKPTLHEQLDRIEARRLAERPAVDEKERLQTVCEELYGQPVPEAWLDEALSPVQAASLPAVRPTPLASPLRSALAPPLPDPTVPRSRWDWAALRALGDRPYARPDTATEWRERQAHHRQLAMWSRWRHVGWPVMMIAGSMLGIMTGVVGLAQRTGAGFGWGVASLMFWGMAGLGLVAWKALGPPIKAFEHRRRLYEAYSADRHEWDRWLTWPVIARELEAVVTDPSGVPLLLGDAWVWNVRLHRESQRQSREKLVDQVRRAARRT